MMSGSHERSEWVEGLKQPNQMSKVGEADPHNAKEAAEEQTKRTGAEQHPELHEATEQQRGLTAPAEEL